MSRKVHIDRPLVFTLALLLLAGCFIFASAAFGLLARGATHVSSVVFNHLVLGVGLGIVALAGTTMIDYRVWRRFAPHLYILALIATALVFIPFLGFSHGGGTRWLNIAGVSFQPAEGLKLAAIILAASYFAFIKGKVSTFTYGFGGYAAILGLPTIILLLQPDIGSLGIIILAVTAIFFAAGASWRQLFTVVLIGVTALVLLAMFKPYVRDRVMTFFNPSHNVQAESYQLRQSLIAIGSGGLTGRGYGQGVQKFTYLPEPMGDSIFAVAAEELGFIGAIGIITLFVAFGLRGYAVAARAPDMFGSLLAIGISTYLISAAFINIGAMVGALPLTGEPLPFMSQGGSAMLVSLASAGILLSISRRQRI